MFESKFDGIRFPAIPSACRHSLVRKGYYLGLDTDDYVCVVCGRRGPTRDWPAKQMADEDHSGTGATTAK